ncbi:biotin--[acetyl-CoA-carboxylase] ligase [uncultured Microbacterium sp.]|uniref:biotin--[acetyl-CoA-carboxylase] ligase n=1 Tax=uncultured Microbacterium sp. TaxID=191216 RepID=UPI00260E89C8|nr:biotin--[acetyl-CoA-carboxylase] ligase [uncultured Microbacterium sp.]
MSWSSDRAAGFARTRAVAGRVDALEQSPSTNAELRDRSAESPEYPHLSVIVTADQTAGRGRLDRSWVTPAGSALAISVLLRDLPADPVAFGWIPLIAGAAMADAVAAQLPDHEVGVKWPNDVFVDERKICGILAEATGQAVVLGAGINTAMTTEQLPVPTATSFAVIGAQCDEDRLVADYVGRVDELLGGLRADGDAGRAGVHAVVSQRCITIGRTVDVSLPDGTQMRGTATRLHLDGRLAIVVDGEERLIAAGDIVHARLG